MFATWVLVRRLRQAIERFSPWLTVSGHDHDSPRINKRWYHQIGQTICVNAGQTDAGPLHYCVIEAEFAKPRPGLPTSMKVTAYPWKESLVLPIECK
jgi:Icc-related predicted phosphoesterase